MKSTFAVFAAALPSMLPSTFASPVSPSVSIEKRAVPNVCQPDGAQANSNYLYWDESATCQAAGVATGCCVTALGTLGCSVKTEDEVSDLKSVVGKHIKKTGQFASTTVGNYTATYDLLEDDKVNPDVLQEWYHALGPDDSLSSGNSGTFAYLLFSYIAKDTWTRVRVSCL
ncbi:hypothetical protein B0A50_07267 [Salinomyces thailandicus]|uniref:Uncharacterized protein n=1 Tax=Salinomyces thailandicus TaxID=706561 RepID=A0A4U0TN22_9PEZI|nr:hypothetical protein B0A50_07267 [Salinomyces thailandica]